MARRGSEEEIDLTEETINLKFPWSHGRGGAAGQRWIERQHPRSMDLFWCPECKNYKSRDEFYRGSKESHGVYAYCKECCLFLDLEYIKRLLVNQEIGPITSEMIELKRQQITMKRILKEFKKWRNKNEHTDCSDVYGQQRTYEKIMSGKFKTDDIAAAQREFEGQIKLINAIITFYAVSFKNKRAINGLTRMNIMDESSAVDLGLGDPEVDRVKCPEGGKLILRAECLDFSGGHHEICSGCEIGVDTKKILLPDQVA